MLRSFRDNIPLGISYEIVLVDGGSTDGTIEWCKTQSDIRLIEHGELKGAIIAFVEGCFAATGKMVLIGNDDIEFFPGSIIAAIVHLEDNPNCGVVAFADNRPLPPHYDRTVYKTLRMGALRKGNLSEATYAQVGLVRKWLGDKVHWWAGEHDEMLVPGLVYAGDNNMSAHIWQYGYTVDPVPACKIEDNLILDDLRKINYERGKINNDSDFYYRQWPGRYGPSIPDKPQLPQVDKRAGRILYLPIYEPGWPIQHHPVYGKHGLRDALARATNKRGEPFIVQEMDYLSIPAAHLERELIHAVETFKPDMIFFQIQAHLPITASMLSNLRNFTFAVFVNWNGDYAMGGLNSPEMMQVLRHIDLQLVVNATPLEWYKQSGVNAAYWQIGYEDVPDELLPDMPTHDVVWLASLYNENRRNLDKMLKEFDYALCQPGDGTATLYDFGKAKAIYRNAKIAISNNDYPDKSAFVSNRLFQELAAGNAVVFQQTIPLLQDFTGLIPGKHYVEWHTNDELPSLIRYYLDPKHEAERRAIADAGTAFVRANHSFDKRVADLWELMRVLPEGKQMEDTVTLQWIGSERGGGGFPSVVNPKGYTFYPPQKTLTVHRRDAEWFLQHKEMWKLAGDYD